MDCSGKTTNLHILAEHLRSRGYKVCTTREPGGTVISEQLREMLLSRDGPPLLRKTELLLFGAARLEHVERVIKPMLKTGTIVISDRFADTTYAYQGKARGLEKEVVEINKFVLDDFEPDYTLFFDLPLEESSRRLGLRTDKQDRIDLETQDFRTLAYAGYQECFINNPHRMFRINASPEPEQVANQVIAWANAHFGNLI